MSQFNYYHPVERKLSSEPHGYRDEIILHR